MKERTLYALLATFFALSRLGYYLLGVRFDARPVLHYFQFIDPELLKHRLFESLWYLHIQPPGWNMMVGAVLKLFPSSYAVVFQTLFVMAGLGMCWSTFYLMRSCGVSRWLAFTLSAWFIVSPGVVLFENYMLYEYFVAVLLLAAAVGLTRFVRGANTISLAVFIGALFSLVLIRNFFHLFYFGAMFIGLAYLTPTRRRAVLLCGILPLLAIIALYTKNALLFGSFSGSTWMGMNMDTITSHQLTGEEAARFEKQGVISRISLVDAGSPISLYRSYIQTPARTGIPELDDCVTSKGASQLQLPCVPTSAARLYAGWVIAAANLSRGISTVLEIAWFTYFLPPSDFPFFDLNRPKIHNIERP